MLFKEFFHLRDTHIKLFEQDLAEEFVELEAKVFGGDALGFAIGFDAFVELARGVKDLSSQRVSVGDKALTELMDLLCVLEGFGVFFLGFVECAAKEERGPVPGLLLDHLVEDVVCGGSVLFFDGNAGEECHEGIIVGIDLEAAIGPLTGFLE